MRLSILALCLISLVGCQRDPVATLKPILATIEESGTVPKKCPEALAAEDLSYDVRKTDSLVSPYRATVRWQSGIGKRGITSEWTANLALQGGKWRLTGLTSEREDILPLTWDAAEDWEAAFDTACQAQ